MLILLAFLEQSGTSVIKLHVLGGSFLLGRLMHGLCMGFMKSNLPLRVGGTAFTLFPLMIAAVALLIQYFE